jgi:hypothetical protein
MPTIDAFTDLVELRVFCVLVAISHFQQPAR